MPARSVRVKRKTRETEISLCLNLDGKGESEVDTGIGFLDHMLTLLAKHGLFDLKIKARGDLKVDIHHTNEDAGICLGEAFSKALGAKQGIKRFGYACIPMDEALARVALDISGRPSVYFTLLDGTIATAVDFIFSKEDEYSFDDMYQFVNAFAKASGINLNIALSHTHNVHHLLEACFKALGRALDEATQLDARVKGIPSTKGRL